MNLLVTAGPTREAIDPVRFLSNRSTGRMGYALAEAGRARGHAVRLVSGPVSLAPPAGVEFIAVESAADMLCAVLKHLSWCDALIMAAAVADWRPAETSAAKLKKAGGDPVLRLVRTDDILERVRDSGATCLRVGFAAETGDPEAEALRKLHDKGLDLMVGNDVSQADAGFAVDTNRLVLVHGPDRVTRLPLLSKRDAADHVLEILESLPPRT